MPGILHSVQETGSGPTSRSFRRRFAVGLLVSAIASFVATAPAGATTGPTPLAHPPRFEVTEAEAAPYIGRFRLVAPLDHRLISGAYVAERNERNYVEGSIAIYHYEAAGRPSALVARTYEYHAVGGRMDIDVISPENQVILARLRLHRSAGKLTGTFTSLMPAGPPQTISLARVAEPPEVEEPATASAAQTGGAGGESAESSLSNARAVAEVVARAVRPF